MRLFVDQLTNLDFSFLDKERGLVGETWLANIELQGDLDEQGMVFDFGDVKKSLRNWLDENIDHKLVIPRKSSHLVFSQEDGYDHLEWESERGQIRSTAPSQAHCLVEAEHITPESVAIWATEKLKALFPNSVHKLILSFTVEAIEGPYYHYSHGLKKHGGNCQRIAHGHRSKIEINEDQQPSLELAQNWARRWKDIYIGSEEDCTQDPDLNGNFLFYYEAQQGHFALSIPKAHCYIMHTETTVELISQHIAQQLKLEKAESSFTVKAYEGMAKGAISEN